MFSLQPKNRLTTFCRLLAGTATLLLFGSSVSWGAVSLTADPAYPDFPDVFTVDPLADSFASRNIAADRNLRQTFKNPTSIDVAQIVLGLAVQAPEGGLVIDIYEVDDVLAAAWTPGPLVHSISIGSTALIGTDERLGVTLTDSDIFSLPARFAGTTGYGLELSNFDGTTNIGAWRHTNTGVDEYTDGVFYVEDGAPSGGSSAIRDIGFSLLDASSGPSTPGDVDGDGDVDFLETDSDMISDLDIIAANFRQGPAMRTTGDLTGDGQVNLFDFREWKANFAAGSLSSSNGQVPEPTTLATTLLLAGAFGFLRRR